MGLEFILILVVCTYLRKTTQTRENFPRWEKIFKSIMIVSIALQVMAFSGGTLKLIIDWVLHLLIFYLVYVMFTVKEFKGARSVMTAIAPYIIVSLLKDLLSLINKEWYKSLNSTLSVIAVFSVIWMIVMWIVINRQRKALEKEKNKREAEEKQNRITTSLKDQLEVQVAQRTAELTLQKEELENTIIELKATQAQLIQSEKMASLGELTAGIAHEIQNPLNFVNNFSEVNAELIEEMKQEIATGNYEEAIAIANDVKENALKITYHGKRADSIVKGMLQHSRTSSSEKELTDINALADEYLRLSYHGLRAKDKSFNASFKANLDSNIGKINIVPQDIGRVILNLINNAFYAVTDKRKTAMAEYEPTVTVSTRPVHLPKGGIGILLSVADNGIGIPQKVADKIFQPFFTTKPTGLGTGLGLSLSYDIIKAHGGEIKMETKEGEGTTFNMYLPL